MINKIIDCSFHYFSEEGKKETQLHHFCVSPVDSDLRCDCSSEMHLIWCVRCAYVLSSSHPMIIRTIT